MVGKPRKVACVPSSVPTAGSWVTVASDPTGPGWGCQHGTSKAISDPWKDIAATAPFVDMVAAEQGTSRSERGIWFWWYFKGDKQNHCYLCSLTYIYLKPFFETKFSLRIFTVLSMSSWWRVVEEAEVRAMLFRNLCWEIKTCQRLHFLFPIWIFSFSVCHCHFVP